MRSKRWIRPAVLGALALALGAGYWRALVWRLEGGLADWAAARRAAGWSVSWRGVAWGAGPGGARLILRDPDIRLPSPGGAQGGGVPVGVVWQAERIDLRLPWLEPWTLGVAARGPQTLRVEGYPPAVLRAEAFEAAFPLAGAEASVRAEGLRVECPVEHEAPLEFSIARLALSGALAARDGGGEAVLEFAARAEGIALPAAYRWPLGLAVDAASAEGTLAGPLALARPPVEAAILWRDGGGSLDVKAYELRWGPLRAAGAATLALDEQLQPMGAGNGALTGYDAALDALAANGVLTRSAAKAARAVLSLLAGTPAPGDEPKVDVPLTLQHRTLSVRQVPLLRLPEWEW
jgi:hypothetical protein